MMDSYLKKHGYIKECETRDLTKQPLTEEEINSIVIDMLAEADPTYDRKAEEELFERVKGIDGLAQYFKETMARDVRRYFKATTEIERVQIRGAFSRTLYFKSLLGDKKKVSGNVKLPGSRYE